MCLGHDLGATCLVGDDQKMVQIVWLEALEGPQLDSSVLEETPLAH